MTPEERQQIETQIKNDFSELQKKLENLKNEVQTESDDSKKQEKNNEIQKLEGELSDMKTLIDTLSSLQEADLQSLKTRLESTKKVYQEYRGEVADLQNKRTETPTTCDLLKGSETYNRLLNIISSNPNKFKKIEGDTAEKKLEHIFEEIRNSIVLFMKNKLGNSENIEKVINDTIAPAFEWNLMEMLKKQGNETNIDMLKGINKISFGDLEKLCKGVKGFADIFSSSYGQFNQWINAIDYLSVHNGVLLNPEKSEVLTSPLEFQKYMNDSRFAVSGFSPYARIYDNIFKVKETQNFEFGMSLPEKQQVLQEIGNIQIVNNPKTTALITKILDKSKQFLQKTEGLQKTANSLLDGVNALNSVTKFFGVDILGEISKAPQEKSLKFRVLDFICKLIGITGGLEGIVKKWRLNRMNLTDSKNNNISDIFKEFKDRAGDNIPISVTGPESCNSALNNFIVTDLNNQSTTMGDYLRDSIAEKMDVSLISPVIIQKAVEENILSGEKNDYLKEEIDGSQNKKIVINSEKFTSDDKKRLAHYHLTNMKSYLEKYNENDLSDFYTNIHSTEDIALCITATLYVNQDDVIEGVKAKVFLPENYGSVRSDGTAVDNQNSGGENLDSTESSERSVVSEQWMYKKIIEYGITDKRQIAYILATVKGETNPHGVGFRNIEEIGKGAGQEYGKIDPKTRKAYYGRGFVQLTWKKNYQQYTKIIRDRGMDFKDNDGNIIKHGDIDLVKDPDIILKSNELAAFILVYGMKNGTFTGKKLDKFINGTKTDFYNARSIVNGMSSNPKEYANNAQEYLNKLGKGSINSPIESNELLIGPHLLAKNKDEIGGLGNSIMNGFQGLDAKTIFPNMDGIKGGSTATHPHRFQSQNDVLAYRNTHPNVKSFLFYFGVNTRDNDRTLSDIKRWSEWLQAEGIQPVLCTCVGEDKKTWLKKLNQNLISLGKEKNRPVIDFAKSYNKGDIALSDGVHPKSYSQMTNIINGVLQA